MAFRNRACRLVIPLLQIALACALSARPVSAGEARIGDLTLRPQEVPTRAVGYGLVVGLDGTGDRSFSSSWSVNPTVHSVLNMLRRFNVEVPTDRIRLRNVAAVLVTAEIPPYLRPGGRFEVQVSSLGDATSLRGGVLWIVPLVTDPSQPPVATAQGPLFISGERGRSLYSSGANSARIPQGGVLEVDLGNAWAGGAGGDSAGVRLLLREPDLVTAHAIAETINAAFGDSAARVADPGAVELFPGTSLEPDRIAFLAAVDTLMVRHRDAARIVIDGREGTIVTGGDVRVSAAVISHKGITLVIGGTGAAPASPTSTPVPGLLEFNPQASVQEVAAGLQAAGAEPAEVAAIFESLQASGALRAEVVVR